ncbi:hypothetical protein GALMADRAFT_254167 [Galerina marginata CBS 339.88]|uniref:Uncharacterized protein n=1 Tax=Galerina marginata (strain CBS 339.88) TaxID=685588 RepID=A0A067SKH2_GALM3|nr:hypothetical protein GALMADRAFT_254167 [Galerina marginata CBS 339.88]
MAAPIRGRSTTVPERRWRRGKSYGAVSSRLTICLQGSNASVFIRHPDLDIDPSSFRPQKKRLRKNIAWYWPELVKQFIPMKNGGSLFHTFIATEDVVRGDIVLGTA